MSVSRAEKLKKGKTFCILNNRESSRLNKYRQERETVNPMGLITYYSTNNVNERVNFETALLRGMAPDYGLYMVSKDDLPVISPDTLADMPSMSYAQIAFEVLNPFLGSEIPEEILRDLLNDAYREGVIPTEVQYITGKTHIMWLTKGPTYSFKDYAARFFGRMLNYFLDTRRLRRVVVVATSGDTGGAVADALHGLANIDNIVFFPRGSISDGQRRQMTTLGDNVYAFEVEGDFDVCQALAKTLLGDQGFAELLFGDPERFTSANSISLGRLLPQAVYPFFAYSRVARNMEQMIASIPSGNFGDMMGTVLAKGMGLPISRIIAGVNENTEFPEFLKTGVYVVRPSVKSPSSAMIVSHPSNLARLIDFYSGRMYDERDPMTEKIIRPGVIARMPDLDKMREDIVSMGVTNPQHYETMRDVFNRYGVILDPHGAVGWRTLETCLDGRHDQPAVIYETADPGKFPEDVIKAIGFAPEVPPGMKRQAGMKERIYSIQSRPEHTPQGLKLSEAQIEEAKRLIKELLAG
ncbi:MAG: Threonine synthase [Syntrophorhabdus sp. PtaB.Bin006]|nr:MAG: Threonine synthase [Syntrophorhabdus sp. PtaB.Bin006]